MQPYGEPAPQGGPAVMTQQEYLTQVSNVRGEIRSLTTSVQSIAGLHQRALGGNDPGAAAQLEQLVSQTQLKNTQIRNQLRLLQNDCERTTDGTHALKKRQFETLNNDFKRELQGYLSEEKQYRERYREQISRQYRIVNPDATEDEVNQAADADWGSEGIFQTAVRFSLSLSLIISFQFCSSRTDRSSSGQIGLARPLPSSAPSVRAITSCSALSSPSLSSTASSKISTRL